MKNSKEKHNDSLNYYNQGSPSAREKLLIMSLIDKDFFKVKKRTMSYLHLNEIEPKGKFVNSTKNSVCNQFLRFQPRNKTEKHNYNQSANLSNRSGAINLRLNADSQDKINCNYIQKNKTTFRGIELLLKQKEKKPDNFHQKLFNKNNLIKKFKKESNKSKSSTIKVNKTNNFAPIGEHLNLSKNYSSKTPKQTSLINLHTLNIITNKFYSPKKKKTFNFDILINSNSTNKKKKNKGSIQKSKAQNRNNKKTKNLKNPSNLLEVNEQSYKSTSSNYYPEITSLSSLIESCSQLKKRTEKILEEYEKKMANIY